MDCKTKVKDLVNMLAEAGLTVIIHSEMCPVQTLAKRPLSEEEAIHRKKTKTCNERKSGNFEATSARKEIKIIQVILTREGWSYLTLATTKINVLFFSVTSSFKKSMTDFLLHCNRWYNEIAFQHNPFKRKHNRSDNRIRRLGIYMLCIKRRNVSPLTVQHYISLNFAVLGYQSNSVTFQTFYFL